MLKNIFKKKASKERVLKAVEHQDTHLGKAQAKASAEKLIARMEQKKREQIAHEQAKAARQQKEI